MPDSIVIASTTDSVEAVQAAAGIKPGEGASDQTTVGQAVATVVKGSQAQEAKPDAETPSKDGATAPAAPVVEAPATEVAAPALTADEQEEADAEAEAARPDPVRQAAGKKRGRLQARIDDLVKERNDERAERATLAAETAALRRRLEELASMSATQPQPQQQTPSPAAPPEPETPPSVTDFNSYEEWVAANTAYQIRQAVAATEARFAERLEAATAAQKTDLQRAQQAAQQAAVVKTYADRLPDAQARYTDWAEVVTEHVPVTPFMAQSIIESEVGPDVAYFLGKNEEQRKQLFALGDGPKAAKLFGKIEAQVEQQLAAARQAEAGKAPPPASEQFGAAAAAVAKVIEQQTGQPVKAASAAAPVTKAADPITPVGTSRSAVETPLDELPYQQYKEARNRQERQRLGLR